MISFVYFDVGGVLIKDFTATGKWVELQRELGIKPEQEKDFIEFYDKYEPEVCLGCEVDSLMPLIKQKFGIEIPPGYSFLKDGFVKRFEVNRSILPVVVEIRKKCRVGMLTNMYPDMLSAIREAKLLPEVEWAAIVDSSVDKVKKPDKQVFDLAQSRVGIPASEILFVENGSKHVNAAASYGWQTFLYNSSNYQKSSDDLASFF